MPWGALPVTSMSGPLGAMFGSLGSFMGQPIMLTLTGWQGSLTLAGVSLPNWLAVVAGVCAGALGFARISGTAPVKRAVPIALAAYALAHVSLLMLMLTSGGSVGAGALLTEGALIAMLITLLKPEPKVSSASA